MRPRLRNGRVLVSYGTVAEAKNQIRWVPILEAEDLWHAIPSMSHAPGVRRGPFEIRSAADVSATISESERLQAADDAGLQSARRPSARELGSGQFRSCRGVTPSTRLK